MNLDTILKLLGLSRREDLDNLKSANRTLNEKTRKQEEALASHKQNEDHLQSKVEQLSLEVNQLKLDSQVNEESCQRMSNDMELLHSSMNSVIHERDQLKEELDKKLAAEDRQQQIYLKIKDSYKNESGKNGKQKYDGRPPKPGVQKNIRFDYDVELLLIDMSTHYVFKQVDFVNESLRAALKKLASEHEEYQEKYNSILLQAREIELQAIEKAEEERTKAKYDKLKQ